MLKAMLFWYLAMQGLALVGLPWAFLWLRRLPSRGYALAKALGLLLVGFLLWWGGILHLWGVSLAAVLTSAALVFVGGLYLLRGEWSAWWRWWRGHRHFILTTELLFAAAFVLWTLVRATQPQIETAGGEKWMEIAFLNATLRSPAMPPHDPWLAGFAISYYYFGYLLMAVLTLLSGLVSTVAFNLANGGWFALAAVGAFGLLYDLLEGERLLAALWSPFLLLLTGNGEGLLEVLHARGLLPAAFWRWLDIRSLDGAPTPPFSWLPQRYFWWWQASRVIHDYDPLGRTQEVIDEFPAFSFVLGDMHPHLLALPFVLLAVGMALDLWRKPLYDPSALLHGWRVKVGYFLDALVLGALGFLNTWDFPIYWGLLVAVLYLRSQRRWKVALLYTAGLIVVLTTASLLLYAPFWIGLRSQAGGLLPNLFNATRWPQFAVVFWPFLIPVGGLVVAAARRAGVGWRQLLGDLLPLLAGVVVAALLVGGLGGRDFVAGFLHGDFAGWGLTAEGVRSLLVERLLRSWVALLLAVALVVLGRALLTAGRRGEPMTFVLILVLLGAGLTFVPEFLYLRDLFGTRMNTVFKFYFEAWAVWSLAAAWWLAKREGSPVLWGLALGFVATGFLYTPLAVRERAIEHGVPWSLDGAAWVASSHPGDWTLITWLNDNVSGRPVIAEATVNGGASYTYGGRISAFTGLPAVVGWVGHEHQWRGTPDEAMARASAIERLYTTTDPAERETILRRYDVAYVIVGEVERQRYDAALLRQWESYPCLYRYGDLAIYAVQP